MSIYWAPDDGDAPVTHEPSGPIARLIAAVNDEREFPYDAQTLRALGRRLWTSARGPRQPSQRPPARRAAGFVLGDRPD